ncbi:tumor necrosis factor ligand superfamily member 18 isoform X2 [Phascolarctos cinereus]
MKSICKTLYTQTKVPESCWAQASLDTKTEATDRVEVKDWKWSEIPTSCMKKTENEKLSITQDGNFLIYSQMKRKRKSHVPFAIRLMRGDEILSQSQSEEDIILLLGIYHLNEGDEISLAFNDENFEHIEKNSTQTYWGILRIPHYDS